MLPLIAYYAYTDDSDGPSHWDEFIGTDWGTDTAQNTIEGAYQSYALHLRDMRDKQGWPSAMVQSLIAKGAVIEDDADSPSDFWRIIGEQEPAWMRVAKVEPGSLAKYESHIAFMQASGASTEALEKAKAEYSPLGVVKGAAKGTFDDVKDKLDPTKSPWPWIAGGVVVLLLLKK